MRLSPTSVSLTPSLVPVTPEDKELQAFVRGVVQSVVRLDLYPKTLIQIVVQELESDAHFLSLSLNCMCAALLDAGLALRGTFAAVTSVIGPSAKLPSDTRHETDCLLTTIYDSTSKQIVAVHQEGRPMSRSELRQCLESGVSESLSLFHALEAAAKT